MFEEISVTLIKGVFFLQIGGVVMSCLYPDTYRQSNQIQMEAIHHVSKYLKAVRQALLIPSPLLHHNHPEDFLLKSKGLKEPCSLLNCSPDTLGQWQGGSWS